MNGRPPQSKCKGQSGERIGVLVLMILASSVILQTRRPLISHTCESEKIKQRGTINVLSLTAVDPIYFISEVPRLIFSI